MIGNRSSVDGLDYGRRTQHQPHRTHFAAPEVDIIGDDVRLEPLQTVVRNLIGHEQIDGDRPFPQEEERMDPARPVEQGRELGIALDEPSQVRGDLTAEEPFAGTEVPTGDLDQGAIPGMRRSRNRYSVDQRLKDSPQPHVFVALGFLKTNPLPLRPSSKSRITSFR